ncbi:MAG: hypothetical protein WD872_05015 [Pirellulaceae bacterium]
MVLTQPHVPAARADIARWFDRGVLLAVVLAASVALSYNVADPDLWGHVQYGRDALHSGLPATTTYSYIAEGYPWINHEILAELALAVANDSLGGTGLLLLKALLGVVVLGLILWSAARQRTGLLATAVVALLAALGLSNHWTLRPQLFSYVSFTLLLTLLSWCFEGWEGSWQLRWPWRKPGTLDESQPLVYSSARMRCLWLVPILMMLWSNAHGGFLAGYCVFVAYLGLRSVEAFCRHGWDAGGLVRRFALMAIAAGLATFINPYSFEFHVWLYHDLAVPRPEILEWRAPDFTSPADVPLAMLIGVAVLGLAASRRQRDFTQLVIVSLILWQSLVHLRHVAFFAIAVGLWLPPHVDSALQRVGVTKPGASMFDSIGPGVRWASAVGLAIAYLLCGGQLFWHLHELRVDRESYPVSAFQYIGREGLTGRMFVTFNWAQYALAAFGPRHPGGEGLLVHVDGRCRTSYSQQMLDEHFDFLMGEVPADRRYRGPDSGPVDRQRVLNHGSPDLVLINRNQLPSVQVMEQNRRDWSLLYQDGLVQLWGRMTRYGNPDSPDYIPAERRMLGDEPQRGYVSWPAIPPYQPRGRQSLTWH